MLRLGEKGAIPQRDNETYAIAPHIPCGLLNPEVLRRLADVAEKYNVKVIAVYAKEAKKGERLGKMIDRIGLEPFKAALV